MTLKVASVTRTVPSTLHEQAPAHLDELARMRHRLGAHVTVECADNGMHQLHMHLGADTHALARLALPQVWFNFSAYPSMCLSLQVLMAYTHTHTTEQAKRADESLPISHSILSADELRTVSVYAARHAAHAASPAVALYSLAQILRLESLTDG